MPKALRVELSEACGAQTGGTPTGKQPGRPGGELRGPPLCPAVQRATENVTNSFQAVTA